MYLLSAVGRAQACTEVLPNFFEIVCCSHQNEMRMEHAGSITDDDVCLVKALVVTPVENAAVECNQDCSIDCFENGHVVP